MHRYSQADGKNLTSGVNQPELSSGNRLHAVGSGTSGADQLAVDREPSSLVCFNGALQVWAVNGWGSLTEFLTDQLDLMIAPSQE